MKRLIGLAGKAMMVAAIIVSLITMGCASTARDGAASGGKTAVAKTYDAEVVIIGGGWAGLIAAVTAGEAGLKTVVLEKLAMIGGGMFLLGATNSGQTADGKSLDELYRQYMEDAHYVSNGKVVRRLINELPNNVKWFLAHKEIPVLGDPKNGGIFFEGGGGGGVLPRVFADMLSKMDNVTILTESPATDLVVENGAVTGVIAQKGADKIRVNGKYILIATGPIVDSPEMMKKYVPWFGEGYRIYGMSGRTGDGITLALQANAKIDPIIGVDVETGWTMGLRQSYSYWEMGKDLEIQTLHNLVKFPVLRVNMRGDRFMDESIQPFHKETHAIARNNNVYWAVYDEALINRLKNDGIDAVGFPRIMFGGVPESKMTAADSALDQAYKAGYAVKADTVEELARKIGADPQTLKDTIARYNDLAGAGKDDDFLKDPKLLYNYSGSPFIAIKGVSTIISSNGGIQCDTNFNVIDQNMRPIPGLYVGGVMVGSTIGDTYPMGGTSSGFGAAAARVVMENAAKELRGN
jgi:fumarate reductase flavoprotein subunit